jgi:hypothetical protein
MPLLKWINVHEIWRPLQRERVEASPKGATPVEP